MRIVKFGKALSIDSRAFFYATRQLSEVHRSPFNVGEELLTNVVILFEQPQHRAGPYPRIGLPRAAMGVQIDVLSRQRKFDFVANVLYNPKCN